MRRKAGPTTRVFESPYATTILPAKDAGRAPKPAAAPASDGPPPAPVAEAPVYIPTHAPAPPATAAPVAAPITAPAAAPVAEPIATPEPAPVYAPAPAPLFAAPLTDYPAHYPSAPGFPPQPAYAGAAQVADPVPSAPPAAPPPVGYPSASYQPASYQPASYQPAAQPNRFEPQGYAAPGYAAPGYPPPGYPPQPYQSFPPPSSRSTGAKVLIGLAVGVIGFVLLGILAAIAIPVFLSQRDKPANRNVVMPAMLLEQQKLTGADLDVGASAAVTALQNIKGLTETQAAYYGSGGQPVFAVAAGKLPQRPTSAAQQSFFSNTAKNNNATLVPTGSGPFGGWMECGQGAAGNGGTATMCVSLDSAAVVVVIAQSTSPNDLAVLTRQVISSVEQTG